MRTIRLAFNLQRIFATLLIIGISLQQINIKVSEPSLLKSALSSGIKTKVLMWGKHDTMDDLKLKAKMADPASGCKKFTNPVIEEAQKYVYFVPSNLSESCALSNLIHNAQQAGASALILEHMEENLSDVMIPDHFHGNKLSYSRGKYTCHVNSTWVSRCSFFSFK